MFVKAGRAQSGVGLVEVLVALLIFTVGVLGPLRMQIAAKRANFEAAQQSVAVSLARDILERIRSNPGDLASYLVEEAGGTVLASGSDCRVAPCSNAQLAVYDLHEWSLRLIGATELVSIDGDEYRAGGLTVARACVRRNSRVVTVTIAWKGAHPMAGNSVSDGGEKAVLYGPGNTQRRQIVMTTYIGNL